SRAARRPPDARGDRRAAPRSRGDAACHHGPACRGGRAAGRTGRHRAGRAAGTRGALVLPRDAGAGPGGGGVHGMCALRWVGVVRLLIVPDRPEGGMILAALPVALLAVLCLVWVVAPPSAPVAPRGASPRARRSGA